MIMKNEITLDRLTLEKVARTARLELAPSEIDSFLPQLQNILEAFNVLQEVDVKDVSPSFQPLPVQNVMRADTVKPSLPVEKALENAPHRKDPFVKGPKVM